MINSPDKRPSCAGRGEMTNDNEVTWLICAEHASGYISTIPISCSKCQKPLVMDAKNALLVDEQQMKPICAPCALKDMETNPADYRFGGSAIQGRMITSLEGAIRVALEVMSKPKKEEPPA